MNGLFGEVLPYMDEQKSGHIISISSVAGHYAHAGGAVYSAPRWQFGQSVNL
ncbi:SDR family NAD(P)-dependent oxidoreductase [Alkalibacterium olivapovliticus]|uniref:Short subunit dehydrogenase n=1 Tax=Alkalibacterium olivapovliticus TaxID=99907 RepID=A0A2T0VX35_9LACT|nr:SDR family NAD(P)-dependent oxidoreductase [Alkalibacterium olivapovliticus]PRY76519.1 short subunit dehydrogenase [Alkalibacterium olivapovliticus]